MSRRRAWSGRRGRPSRDSFITATVPDLPFDETERNLYRWYLYRRPSLALAVVISPPDERAAHELRIASFIRRRLHERVPLLMLSLSSADGAAAVLAGGRVVTSGVVLTMIKTDLKFSLERFHSFEPVGVKLFVTGAEGDRVLECNRQPALEAYCESLGLDPGGGRGRSGVVLALPAGASAAATVASTCCGPRRSGPTGACASRRRWSPTGCCTR